MEAVDTYPKHSCDFPGRRKSQHGLQWCQYRWRTLLTDEMQLLVESVAWFDMLADARRFRACIWSSVNMNYENS